DSCGECRGGPRHDRAEGREGLRHRESLRDLQKLIVPERDEAVDALLEQVELRFRELAANRTFDPERDRGEAQGRVSQDPRDPADAAPSLPDLFAFAAAADQDYVPFEARR